jgi:hypothetical protein
MDRKAPAHIRAEMGTQLRRMYTEAVGEGVPARFVELLRGLDTPDLEGGSNK